jgi:predicted transcriptional regulator
MSLGSRSEETKLTPSHGANAPLGPLELEVMRKLWEQPSLPAIDITGMLNGQRSSPLSSKTVLTTLTRLESKGLVSHQKQGRAFLFSAAKSEEGLAAWFVGNRIRPILELYGDLAVAVFVEQVAALPVRYRFLRHLVEADDERDHP